ncbi:MAG: hypothetical protein LBJ00_09400 [Planctomycetaceae bacterium]|nr:hypothetical protein [Planctomycetaceae bacterium]
MFRCEAYRLTGYGIADHILFSDLAYISSKFASSACRLLNVHCNSMMTVLGSSIGLF